MTQGLLVFVQLVMAAIRTRAVAEFAAAVGHRSRDGVGRRAIVRHFQFGSGIGVG